ncbi:MAG: ABC transporter permease [Dehalococcoidia bacterium]
MTAYIIRRLLIAVVVLIIVSLIVFFVMRLLPGDPLVIFLGRQAGTGSMSEQQLEELYVRYGLDKPLIVQYWDWIYGFVQGDMGESIYYHEDVSILLLERFPVTLDLGLKSFILYNILGVVMGMIAALRRGKWIDTVATVLSYIGVSIPVFWLGLLLIYLFGLQLDWFPIMGYTLSTENLWQNMYQSFMPVICLSLMGWAVIARQTRSSMLEVMSQDYVRTAWSKGLTEFKVVFKHMLKNSLIPVITLMGVGLGLMFGGQVFIEQVFAIPGVGRLLVSSVFAQDYQVVQSATLIIATIVILVNLIVDISYAWFDPRIRYG